jgi:hypothetical protein
MDLDKNSELFLDIPENLPTLEDTDFSWLDNFELNFSPLSQDGSEIISQSTQDDEKETTSIPSPITTDSEETISVHENETTPLPKVNTHTELFFEIFSGAIFQNLFRSTITSRLSSQELVWLKSATTNPSKHSNV